MKKHLILYIAAALACLSSCTSSQHGDSQSHPVSEPMEWRGVMIDASRHFWPIDVLKRQVDVMSHYGLNILHLHLTDAAGWRLEIKKYPRLTDVGAWRTHETWKEWWEVRPRASVHHTGVEWFAPAYASEENGFGGYYSQNEMRQLVRYAAERGVTIVPEIEFPAHSEEVVAAYPWLGYNHAEMDISQDSTYIFMKDVLTEVADVFPSKYIHVGGDEAATQTGQQPQAMRKIQSIVEGLGRRMVVWDEGLTDNPADSAQIIMVWRNPETAAKAIRLGHEVVMCPSNWCYLDSYQDNPMDQPEAMGGYRPLSQIYALPLDSALQAEKEASGRLLGIQACLFTEYVPTREILEYQLWPRALAIAERGLGIDRPYEEFHHWAVAVTDSMRREGINAFDLAHEYGERQEALTPVKHLARGAKVTYNIPYSTYYPAAGDMALVDGACGTWNNNDNRWQGFCSDVDIVLDLEKEKSISSIEISFMQVTGPEIFLPATVEATLYGGSDKSVVRANCTVDLPDSLMNLPYVVHPYKVTFSPALNSGRLQIKAKRTQRAGWLFVDEVQLR